MPFIYYVKINGKSHRAINWMVNLSYQNFRRLDKLGYSELTLYINLSGNPLEEVNLGQLFQFFPNLEALYTKKLIEKKL